jgi:DNA-binding transcriptional ArsR family regulator
MGRPAAHTDPFRAIADPTRRRMLELLLSGEQPVSALAQPFEATLPAISQHLKVLKEAHLVTERKAGRQRLYRLNPEPLAEVARWMSLYERFWVQKLGALGDFLEEQARVEATPSSPPPKRSVP